MGSYLNPGNFSFRGSLRSKIYVDKSELIAKTNEALCTEQRYICVSRPRRFGKSMAANMLAAYYDRSENTEELFRNLAISKDSSYKENLNQYDVIKINMQEFLSMSGTMEEMLDMLKKYLVLMSGIVCSGSISRIRRHRRNIWISCGRGSRTKIMLHWLT